MAPCPEAGTKIRSLRPEGKAGNYKKMKNSGNEAEKSLKTKEEP
jgi:hypothetical protein